MQDSLREEKRQVNHHGRVRTLGPDGEPEEEEEENGEEEEGKEDAGVRVLQKTWVGGMQQGEMLATDTEEMKEMKLNLVSRHEDVQVTHSQCLSI